MTQQHINLIKAIEEKLVTFNTEVLKLGDSLGEEAKASFGDETLTDYENIILLCGQLGVVCGVATKIVEYIEDRMLS